MVYTPSSGGAASFGTSGAGSAIIATVPIPAAELVPSSAPTAATAPTAGSSNVEVFQGGQDKFKLPRILILMVGFFWSWVVVFL